MAMAYQLAASRASGSGMADTDTQTLIADMTARARVASRALAAMTSAQKSRALFAAAAAIREASDAIVAANAEDMAAAEASGLSGAMLDRLRLDAGRVEATAAGVDAVARLDDPVGKVIERVACESRSA
jgi:glutamate-5-semialdehyde dehydrogenase